jgi:hypothetical protein
VSRDDADPDAFDVPPGADPVRCSHCGRPFTREAYLALHRGLAHDSALSPAEREAFEEARAAEAAALGKFRLQALGVLVLLYFGLVMTYAVV